MGTPNTGGEPNFDDGELCEDCSDLVFYGRTPLYVKATFAGYEICPAYEIPDFPSERILKQDDDFPCVWLDLWNDVSGLWTIRYECNTGDEGEESRLLVTCQAFPLWNGKDPAPCALTFSNEQTCPGGFTGEGTGAITFGPDINEEAYEAQ